MHNDLIRLAKDYKKISVANLLKDIKNKSKKLNKLKSKDNLDKLIEFGQLLLKGGDQQHAIQIFSVVLELEPQHFIAMTYIAAIFEDVGQHQQALPLYTQAFESNQNNLNLASRIAWCQFKVGQHESGLGLMEKLINLKPDEANYYQMTAEMLFSIGQAGLAKELILGFISRIYDESLCFTLAKHYFKVKDFASAVELFSSINKQLPNQSHYEAHLAYALASNHQYDESRKWALLALRKDKSQLKAWNALGFYYFSLKANFKKAKNYYQKVLDIDPNDVECLVNVGFMAQKSGLYQEALEFGKRVLVINPENREAIENLSIIYRDKKFIRKHFQWFEYRNKPEISLDIVIWDGAASFENKNILILDEQGIGDLYSEAWYFQLLKELNIASVTVQVDHRALDIFKQSFPEIQFFSDVSALTDIQKYDFYLYRSSLGLVFWRAYYLSDYAFYNSENLDVWQPISFLKAKPQKQATSKTLKVGISWRSGVKTLGRSQYYFKVEEFLGLFSGIDQIEIFVLQYSLDNDESDYLNTFSNVVIPDMDLKDDQKSLADLMMSLDCVVGVCNAVSALAAALGKPVIQLEPNEKLVICDSEFKVPSKLSVLELKLDPSNPSNKSVFASFIKNMLAKPTFQYGDYFSFKSDSQNLMFVHGIFTDRIGMCVDLLESDMSVNGIKRLSEGNIVENFSHIVYCYLKENYEFVKYNDLILEHRKKITSEASLFLRHLLAGTRVPQNLFEFILLLGMREAFSKDAVFNFFELNYLQEKNVCFIPSNEYVDTSENNDLDRVLSLLLKYRNEENFKPNHSEILACFKHGSAGQNLPNRAYTANLDEIKELKPINNLSSARSSKMQKNILCILNSEYTEAIAPMAPPISRKDISIFSKSKNINLIFKSEDDINSTDKALQEFYCLIEKCDLVLSCVSKFSMLSSFCKTPCLIFANYPLVPGYFNQFTNNFLGLTRFLFLKGVSIGELDTNINQLVLKIFESENTSMELMTEFTEQLQDEIDHKITTKPSHMIYEANIT